MFAVTDVCAIAGVDGAWIVGPVTLQAEATIFQLVRARDADTQPDRARTNLTSGLAAGWAATPRLSAGLELRYQRWLSTPAPVAADQALRDTLSAALGLRLTLRAGGAILRPGAAIARGLDDPMAGQGYTVLLVDLIVVRP
jgi:hypothetical protein